MAAAEQRINPRVLQFGTSSVMAWRWEEHPLHIAPVQPLLKCSVAVWAPDFQNIWQVAWSAEQECNQGLE